jgi:hypothetical protein
LKDRPKTEFISGKVLGCEAFEKSVGEKQIILRLDDVQAYTWGGVTFRMIDDTLALDMPMLLGVIPAGLEEDQKMLNYLKANACNAEIALHGWDHQDDPPEFAGISEEEAYQKIVKGKEVLSQITDKPVITFIPPHNQYSSGAKEALIKTDFRVISSEGDGEFDYTASTYDSEKEILNSVSKVVERCREGLEINNRCVIMLHPQDYATDFELDEEKYALYLELLEELRKLDASFVRVEDLVN